MKTISEFKEEPLIIRYYKPLRGCQTFYLIKEFEILFA